MFCSSASLMWNPFCRTCARPFTPKERITPPRLSRSVRRLRDSVSAWRSWATPRITRRTTFSTPCARRRMPEPRFLVVRLGSLGDIIHTFPAVAALRESFPSARIVWLTHPRWAFLVQSSRLATEIWTVETRALSSVRETLRRLRQIPWSAAIDYQGLWKSAMLPFFGGVTRRIGFSSATIREFGVPVLYTERVKTSKAHIAEQNGDLSLRAGAQRGTAPASLQIPQEDQAAVFSYLQAQSLDRYIVLSPGGGWRSKCWPAERFGVLCRKLRDSLQLRCVVNVGPGDDDLAAALLGRTDPARNGPYRLGEAQSSEHKDFVLRTAGVRTTHKRDSQPHPSMLALNVNQVFDAVCRCIGAAR